MENQPEHIRRLTSVPSDMEASVIVAALHRAGITATATGGFTAGFKAEAPGWVQVMVAEADLPVAKNTLAKLMEENAEIDWSKVDVGEPGDLSDDS
ncbi:MAG: hypothetical protein AAGF31_10630 [Planctomycetota bacterium]